MLIMQIRILSSSWWLFRCIPDTLLQKWPNVLVFAEFRVQISGWSPATLNTLFLNISRSHYGIFVTVSKTQARPLLSEYLPNYYTRKSNYCNISCWKLKYKFH